MEVKEQTVAAEERRSMTRYTHVTKDQATRGTA